MYGLADLFIQTQINEKCMVWQIFIFRLRFLKNIWLGRFLVKYMKSVWLGRFFVRYMKKEWVGRLFCKSQNNENCLV